MLEVLEVPGIGGILPWKPLSISCGPLLIPLRCPAGSSLFVSCIDYFEWILSRKNLNRGLWFLLLNDFCFFVFKMLRKSMIAFGVWHWMPILVFLFLPLSVHLRLRRLFVGLDELLFGRDFLHVEVLVFFVSSRDAEVLGDQVVQVPLLPMSGCSLTERESSSPAVCVLIG